MPKRNDQLIRISTRVPATVREVLDQAAESTGVTLDQFVVSAAFQEARRIIDRETVVRLSERDARKVYSLLKHPPRPNKRLKEAAKAYRELVRG